VLSLAGEQCPLTAVPRLGDWTAAGDVLRVAPGNGFNYAALSDVPRDFVLRFRFRAESSTSRFGVCLRTDADLTGGYRLALEPARRQVRLAAFDAARRPIAEPVTRPWPAPDEETSVTVVVSGSIVEAFVDDRIALVGRFYDHRGESLALFVEDGGGEFADVEVRALVNSN
jgi:beta-fructofuranosidase